MRIAVWATTHKVWKSCKTKDALVRTWIISAMLHLRMTCMHTYILGVLHTYIHIYIYIYICIYMCRTHIYIYIYVCRVNIYRYMCVYMYSLQLAACNVTGSVVVWVGYKSQMQPYRQGLHISVFFVFSCPLFPSFLAPASWPLSPCPLLPGPSAA